MVPQVHRKTRTARWTRGHSSTKLAHQRCRRTRNGRYVQPHRPDACARPCTLARTHARTHARTGHLSDAGWQRSPSRDACIASPASHSSGMVAYISASGCSSGGTIASSDEKKPMTYSDTAQVPVVTRLIRVRSGTRRLYWQRRGSVEWNAAL